MAHRVRFQCSDREAVAAHGESVLDAAIRAGLNVDYGCNNGNCGRCVARLLEGEVRMIRHHDYTPSVAEKADGQFLACSYAPASDLVVDAGVGEREAAIPEQSFIAKLKKVSAASEDVRILALRTPRSQRLRFFAGQYARLSGKRFGEVQCSIASCPCEEVRLEFHVPRASGEFGDYVFGACRIGDEVEVTAPYGNFVFSEDVRRTALLIAFETGFAPIKSLIEHVTGQEEEVALRLYWITGAGKPYLDNLCRAWNDAFDRLSYTPVALDPRDDVALEACTRRIAEECADPSSSDAYVCAPQTVGDAVSRALLARGVAPGRLFREDLRGVRC